MWTCVYTQVDTAGDVLSCAAMSPSGEALLFGGSGGYTHLWSSSTNPRVVAHNRPLVVLKHPTAQVWVGGGLGVVVVGGGGMGGWEGGWVGWGEIAKDIG